LKISEKIFSRRPQQKDAQLPPIPTT